MTQRDRFHAATHGKHAGLPKYRPPALRDNRETPRHSFHHNPWPQNFRRDPPPHKDPPICSPRPLDSPNWCAPSPNRHASFRSPSPPPQSPPTSPRSSLCPDIPPRPQKCHNEPQFTSELISILKTASEALQNVIRIAEKLMWQVNVGRWRRTSE